MLERNLLSVAAVAVLLSIAACSHPAPDLRYPDGNNRIPINPQKAEPVQKQVVPQATTPGSGERS